MTSTWWDLYAEEWDEQVRLLLGFCAVLATEGSAPELTRQLERCLQGLCSPSVRRAHELYQSGDAWLRRDVDRLRHKLRCLVTAVRIVMSQERFAELVAGSEPGGGDFVEVPSVASILFDLHSHVVAMEAGRQP